MEQTTSSKTLAADRWLLAGNFLTIIGSCFVGIGTILKLASGPGLPHGKPVFSSPTKEPEAQVKSLHDAASFFKV